MTSRSSLAMRQALVCLALLLVIAATIAADNSVAPGGSDSAATTGAAEATEIIFYSQPLPPVLVSEDVVLTVLVRNVGDHGFDSTGTITFKESGAGITGCVDVPMAASQANCTIPAGTMTAGVKALTAEYSGDGAHDPSSAAMEPAGFTYIECTADPVVTTGAMANDGAAGSLRWALQNACAGSVITFALTDGPDVVPDDDEPFDVVRDVTINGPGIGSVIVRPGAGWSGIRPLFDIHGDVTVTIRDISVRDGRHNSGAAGISLTLGTLTLERVLMSGHAGSSGGAIGNPNGVLVVRDSFLQGNSALEGGAISCGGTTTIINSTITGNTARGDGGGIVNRGSLTIINTTITDNRSDSDNSSFGIGGGIRSIFEFAQPVLYNTIVTGNRGLGDIADDLNGRFNTGSTANLIGVDTNLIGITHGGANGNLVGSSAAPIDPMLGTLGNYGGPTETYRLLDGSPALDAGRSVVDPITALPLATDQRGQPRPADSSSIANPVGGNGNDIGAFEAPAAPTPVLPALYDTGASNSDGITSATEPVFDIDGVTVGAIVELLVDDVVVNSGTAATTTIQLSAPAPLAEGPHQIGSRQTVLGVTSPLSTELAITIDTTAPGATTINLDAASDSGGSNSDDVTNASTRVFSIGTTAAGETAQLLRDGSTVNATIGTGAALTLSDSTAAVSGSVYDYVARQIDLAGNFSDSSAISVTFDNTRPAVTIDSAAGNPTNTSPIAIAVTFTEDVSDFAAGDLVVSNGTVGNFSGSGAAYSFEVTPSGEGEVTVDIAADAAMDLAGNTSTAATQFSRDYDASIPAATIAVTPDPRNTSVGTIDIVFGEPVTGVTLGALTLTRNGGGNLLTGSENVTTSDGITWTLDNLSGLTGADGSYTVTLTATGSGIADSAGNLLTTDAGDTWVMDATGPAVTITQAVGQADPTNNTGSVHFTAVFNEAINPATFTDSDIDLSAGDATATAITLTEIAPNNATTFDVALSGITPGHFIAAIQAGAVEDLLGNLSNVATSTDNDVEVLDCAGFALTVTSTDDNGPGTLRQALADVCPAGTIDFDLPGPGPHTISFTSGAMSVARNVTISGPANQRVILDGGDANALIVVLPAVTARIDNLTFANALGTGNGPALANFGTVSIFNSLVTGSHAWGNGGAIANEGVMGLANSTVSDNTAEVDTVGGTGGGTGGGIFNGSGGVLFLLNATITNNFSVGGGAGLQNIGNVYVENTILAGNFNFGLGDGSTNLVDDAGGVTNNLGHNLIGGNPKIGPLGDNGGLTPTHPLLAGSPAIDAGNTAFAAGIPLVTDQRGAGFVRIADGPDADTLPIVDIGAFEADPSVEEIAPKFTLENTPFEFTFNVGGAAGPDPITVTAGSLTVPPDNLELVLTQQSPSSWKVTVTPKPDFNGFFLPPMYAYVRASKSIGGHEATMTSEFQVLMDPVPSSPTITGATTMEDTPTTSGLVITRNAQDGTEISHFKITTITNGTLFRADGVTPVPLNSFITASQGAAGLRFRPAPQYFGAATVGARAATGASNGGVGGAERIQTISVAPVADTPGITNAATIVDYQTTNGLVITRDAADGTEVTHFKVTAITGGTLFQHDGVTPITVNAFITAAQGGAGLRFTPSAGSAVTGQVSVRASLSSVDAGLGGGTATASITVTPAGTFSDNPLVSGVTPIRLVHLIELRARINAQRVRFGLAEVGFSTQVAGVSVMTGQHLLQIRTALSEAYAAHGLAAPTFTDPGLPAGTMIRAVHIQELRAAILALEAM